MRYDYQLLYKKNAQFYNARPKLKKLLFVGNTALTLGFFVAYAFLVVFSLLSPENFTVYDCVKILVIPSGCLFFVAVLRVAVNRPRPYSEKGANITPLLQKKGAQDKSFPSRHLASAIVIACVFLPYYLLISAILFPLAILLGYIRFALGLHYPSDLFGGAILGGLCSLFLLL